LKPGFTPSGLNALNAYIIRESDVTEKMLPSMRQQPANVNTDMTEMGLALPGGEHRPDYDHLPKPILIASSIPSFSEDITHHQENHTHFSDRVQNDRRHSLTHDVTIIL
jgi:hypothetical protein